MADAHKRINIIGGGPGGLFLAILLRQHRPDWSIQVLERNAPHATFGFGVVFSDRTVELLDQADPASLERIRCEFQSWTDIEVGTWHGVRRTGGHGFSAIARHRLLAILQQRARELDVPVHYEHEVVDFDQILQASDLLVGADGLNSLVRQHWADEFQPDIRMGRARFIWFATPRRYDALTFHFVDTPYGPFSTHAYPFSNELSTFIVEVDADTWQRAGLDPAGRPALGVGETDEYSKAFCEEIFTDSLQGQALVGNASQWRQFPTVRNRSWKAANKVVILGDAAHTAHFSVGSGTKMAMEDAAALAEVLLRDDGFPEALVEYERLRKPSVTRIQQLAEPSRGWWENFQSWVDRDLDTVSVNFLTRTGRETIEHLARRDPDFTSQAVRPGALEAPLRLSEDLILAHRRGLVLSSDPLQRRRTLTVAAREGECPSLVVITDPEPEDVAEVRAAFTNGSTLIAARIHPDRISSHNTDADLLIVDAGVAAPSRLHAVRFITPSSIDDEQGWQHLLEAARLAEAAGASAICLEAAASDIDRRSLIVHAGIIIRPHVRIPIMVWGCSSDQEALTHLNADRADLVVGVPSAAYFPRISQQLGLESLLSPESVVVVGASENSAKAGHTLMTNLGNFSGEVCGLGRSEGEVQGRRIVTDMAELDACIDLAVLAIPSEAIPTALENLGKHGVRAAIICSGGFAETGSPEGIALQAEVDKIRRRHEMRILGPNTSGMALPPLQLHASFVPAVTRLMPGSVAVIAQSGGVAHATALALHSEGIGVGTMIGTGNAVDVDLPELITAIARRGQHSCISVHLEGTSDGAGLIQAIELASRSVPVVVLKSGVSDVDRLAASHTGALTGDWKVAQALLTEAGAVVVSTLGDLVDAVTGLSITRLAPGPRPAAAGVVTGQAGPGILLTDRLQTLGVAVPPLSPPVAERLEELLPALTHRQNPVDTGRPGDAFAEILTVVGSDPGIDVVVVYALLEPGAVDLESSLDRAARSSNVPLLASTNGLVDEVGRAREVLRRSGIPLYTNPERAARGAWALFEDRRAAFLRDQKNSNPIVGTPIVDVALPLTEADAKAYIQRAGVQVPKSRVCPDRQSARTAFAELSSEGDPVVVKIHSTQIGHKAAVGGVHLDVITSEELERALDDIDRVDRRDSGYLVEEQVDPGTDLFIAARHDPSWGSVGLLGLGGGDVEASGSVALFALPASHETVRDVLSSLVPDASDRAGEVLRIVGQLEAALQAWPEAESFEINPLRITPQGLVALDALVDVK